ncbi:MAG: hypothetical protein ABIK96_10095 [bacterium]
MNHALPAKISVICWVILAGIVLVLVGCQEDNPVAPRPLVGVVAVLTTPDSIKAPWRLEAPDGRWSAGLGDTILAGNSVGRYRLVWDSLEGWDLPDPALATDSLAAGDTLRFHGIFTLKPRWGTVEISAQPAGLPVPWALRGPASFYREGTDNPALLTGLPPGDYTVTWGDLQGWVHVGDPTVGMYLAAGGTLRFSHVLSEYSGPTGGLNISIFPPGFHAGWELHGEGGYWAGRGPARLENIPVGTYQMTWEHVLGYDTYPQLTVAVIIQPDTFVFTSAFYLFNDLLTGTITIIPAPAPVPFPWTLTGPGNPVQGTGTRVLSHQVPGDYSLTWGNLEGFRRPEPPTVEFLLPESGSVEIGATYISEIPLAVNDLRLSSTGVPGQVKAAWSPPSPTLHPLDKYLVGFSPDGPLDEDSWDASVILAEVPAVPGQVEYTILLEPGSDGLIPGLPVWFGVRARDTMGQLSPLEGEYSTVPSFVLDAAGRVRDIDGLPLVGVPVRLTLQGGGVFDTFTDAAGTFGYSQVLADSRLNIETGMASVQPGSYFDYNFVPQVGDTLLDLEIVLLPRHRMDSACVHQTSNFVHYFREMTNTINPTSNRPDTRLNKWETWPLVVYIPPDPATGSPPFQAMSSGAVALWNQIMGETFALTGDPGAAQVVFRFADDFPHVNGQVSVLLPAGGNFIGDVIPEKMEVYINTVITNQQRIMEVALHELGHVLGIADHSTCSAAGYLMYISSAGVLDDGPENAIHPDEQLLVKAIRGLPQGVDTSGYIED